MEKTAIEKRTRTLFQNALAAVLTGAQGLQAALDAGDIADAREWLTAIAEDAARAIEQAD